MKKKPLTDSLDACRIMESTLCDEQCFDYEINLKQIVLRDLPTDPDDTAEAYGFVWHATVAQRCEALLLTVGK
jgi:hypothetical protein